jgi:hypothetical protein
VLVCARIRPRLNLELMKDEDAADGGGGGGGDDDEKPSDVVTLFRNEREVMLHRGSPTGGGALARFEFDNVFPPSARQRDVSAVAADAVPGLLRGQNIAVLAYGQTGSGKTYTMEGPPAHSNAAMKVDRSGGSGGGEASSELAGILERRRRLSDVGLAKSPPGTKAGSGGLGWNDAGEHEAKEKSDSSEGDRGVYYAVLARLFADIDTREDEDAAIHAAGMARSPSARNNYGKRATPTPKKIRGRSVEVVMQLLEVYNDTVYDLMPLAQQDQQEGDVDVEDEDSGMWHGKPVEIKQSGRSGRTHVPGATSVPVHSYEEACEVLQRGLGRRSSASHSMNERSSRSHLVVLLKTTVTRRDDTRAFGQLFLVDLAGSEQVKKSEGKFCFLGCFSGGGRRFVVCVCVVCVCERFWVRTATTARSLAFWNFSFLKKSLWVFFPDSESELSTHSDAFFMTPLPFFSSLLSLLPLSLNSDGREAQRGAAYQ